MLNYQSVLKHASWESLEKQPYYRIFRENEPHSIGENIGETINLR